MKKPTSAQAGDPVKRRREFRCCNCYTKIQVSPGQTIPKCPLCGNEDFETRDCLPEDD